MHENLCLYCLNYYNDDDDAASLSLLGPRNLFPPFPTFLRSRTSPPPTPARAARLCPPRHLQRPWPARPPQYCCPVRWQPCGGGSRGLLPRARWRGGSPQGDPMDFARSTNAGTLGGWLAGWPPRPRPIGRRGIVGLGRRTGFGQESGASPLAGGRRGSSDGSQVRAGLGFAAALQWGLDFPTKPSRSSTSIGPVSPLRASGVESRAEEP